MSLSGINYSIGALVEEGWLKMGNCSKETDRLQYTHLLTPTGMAEKAVLTRRFLQRKMAEYENRREETEVLKLEAQFGHQPNVPTLSRALGR